MTPRFIKLSVALAIVAVFIVIVFVYPRSAYGEGLAFFQGASYREGNQTKVFDPVDYLSDIRGLLLLLCYN